MTHDFATKPVLTGALVTLRPFEEADLPAIAEVLNDPEVGRLTMSYTSTTELEADRTGVEDVREFYLGNTTATHRLDLAIVDNASGAVVGEAVLNDYDPNASSCNFRILIGSAGRGRGLGTEATRLITDHGLDVIGLHRIGLDVFSFNPAGRRAYEKAGFVFEGTKRDAAIFDGERIDEHFMSRLATDPRP
ncbi:GNAT family N-acetyltransferase [Occultella gossypii]|uniref:GNAT family N-acetyltransferase n=1 Tax=Occultella gossypii TaxID=2800820 RepID=A0ABS7SD97_9MICO|nr:GNAT family protein [Occultella gossypii]MBZ2198336.1 GNAT family N-acetyltransferase [Occultella gossypii]